MLALHRARPPESSFGMLHLLFVSTTKVSACGWSFCEVSFESLSWLKETPFPGLLFTLPSQSLGSSLAQVLFFFLEDLEASVSQRVEEVQHLALPDPPGFHQGLNPAEHVR